MINSRVTGYIIRSKGNKWTMQVGFITMLFSLLLMTSTKPTTSLYELMFMFALFGISVPASNLPSMNAANEFIPAEKTGIASGMIFTIRWLGGTIGAAVTTVFFNALLTHSHANPLIAMTHALSLSCLVLAIIALLGLILATLGLKAHR